MPTVTVKPNALPAVSILNQPVAGVKIEPPKPTPPPPAFKLGPFTSFHPDGGPGVASRPTTAEARGKPLTLSPSDQQHTPRASPEDTASAVARMWLNGQSNPNSKVVTAFSKLAQVTLDDYATLFDGKQSERGSSRSIVEPTATAAPAPTVAEPPAMAPSPSQPPLSPPRALLSDSSDPLTAKYGVAFAKGAFASIRLEIVWDENSRGHAKAVHVVKTYLKVVAAAGSGRQMMHEHHVEAEMRLVGKLQHPSIICPFKVVVSAAKTDFYMEHAPNGDLETYVTKHAITERLGRKWFSQLLDALVYLHGIHLAHRDIKLENIVLDESYNARLIDFGASEDVSPTTPQQPLMQPTSRRVNILQGTPGYMSPEALKVAASRHGDYDALHADMWSAGVALYCLFNGGVLPFTGRDVHELRQRVVSTEPVPPAFMGTKPLPLELVRLLMRKEPGRRPTAVEARGHVWLKEEEKEAPAAPPTEPKQAWGEEKKDEVVEPKPVAVQAQAPASYLMPAPKPAPPQKEVMPDPRLMQAVSQAAGRPTGLAVKGGGGAAALASARRQHGLLSQSIFKEAVVVEEVGVNEEEGVRRAPQPRPTVAEMLIRNPQGWRELVPLDVMRRDARERK